MPWAITTRNALLAGSILLLAGCSFVYARLTYDFVALPGNNQVLHEPGAEDLAKRAAAEFASAIDTVEKRQYVRFKNREAIKIYVFKDQDHYAKFGHASVLTRGSSATDEVYLSPKLRERIDTLPNILVHELSHVHIRQYTGTFRNVTDIPGWFLEGIAVSVSSGGGAETVTTIQAAAAIRSGTRFQPDDSGRIIGYRTASDYHLEPHMYYRQASLFVEYLQRTDPGAFEKTLLAILNGARFRDAWLQHYGKTISELWQDFEAALTGLPARQGRKNGSGNRLPVSR